MKTVADIPFVQRQAVGRVSLEVVPDLLGRVEFRRVLGEELGVQSWIVAQHQVDAAVSLAYNIGLDAFRNSSVLKLINDPKSKTNYSDLESAWKAWKNSQGKVNQGLVNRRQDEWELYCNGDYERNH